MAKSLTPAQRMVVAAGLAAGVFVTTTFVRIPIPATGGYLNLGDVVIVFAGLTFGPVVGLIAGGIGSAAADLIGFPVFALPTLVIKGLVGLLVGLIGWRASMVRAMCAAILAELWMVLGYFLVESFVFKASMGIAAALSEVWFNLAQALFGAVVGYVLWLMFARRGIAPSGNRADAIVTKDQVN